MNDIRSYPHSENKQVQKLCRLTRQLKTPLVAGSQRSHRQSFCLRNRFCRPQDPRLEPLRHFYGQHRAKYSNQVVKAQKKEPETWSQALMPPLGLATHGLAVGGGRSSTLSMSAGLGEDPSESYVVIITPLHPEAVNLVSSWLVLPNYSFSLLEKCISFCLNLGHRSHTIDNRVIRCSKSRQCEETHNSIHPAGRSSPYQTSYSQ